MKRMACYVLDGGCPDRRRRRGGRRRGAEGGPGEFAGREPRPSPAAGTAGRPRPRTGAEERERDMIIPYGTPVSPEMERALDGLTGLGDRPEGTGDRPAGTADAYPSFTWLNGCYYGKYGESGRWYLQYCNRYRPASPGRREPIQGRRQARACFDGRAAAPSNEGRTAPHDARAPAARWRRPPGIGHRPARGANRRPEGLPRAGTGHGPEHARERPSRRAELGPPPD